MADVTFIFHQNSCYSVSSMHILWSSYFDCPLMPWLPTISGMSISTSTYEIKVFWLLVMPMCCKRSILVCSM